ncbi:hypothetical protein D1953_18160 [Peribacillus asahii]|uniref:Uncharacterized protein n=1 Tax=Peribacillus asahii TaxID=228899 RepID=A0A398B0H0_9BACI|nr:hypothetical protein D1953_18160 [Peribacillus asahii]
MTVLFGTVEYFEQEVLRYLSVNQMGRWTKEDEISLVYSKLEDEILYDFICHEKLRIEYLKNLTFACNKLKIDNYQYV